jgi:hypothetical protein
MPDWIGSGVEIPFGPSVAVGVPLLRVVVVVVVVVAPTTPTQA